MRIAQLLVLAAKRSDYRRVHKAADDYVEQLDAMVRRAFQKGRKALDRGALVSALQDASEKRVLSLVSEAITATQAGLEGLSDLLLEVLVASATSMEGRLRAARFAAPKVKDFSFDKTNDKATGWAKDHAGELIQGLSKTTRDEIRDLVEGAFEEQYDVDELADKIEELIGDEARAQTIARTETMKASNQGQKELWEQATEKGLLTGKEQQEWIVTPDDRLCDVCEPMDGETAPMDGQFRLNTGEDVDGPPAHPNCRCTIALSV